MCERKKINIHDLNPEFKVAYKKLMHDISLFLPPEKKMELERVINSQAEYINELLEKLILDSL